LWTLVERDSEGKFKIAGSDFEGGTMDVYLLGGEVGGVVVGELPG
jgi:hypothetical protein